MLDGHVYLVCLVPAKQTVDKSRRVADRRQVHIRVLPLQVHCLLGFATLLATCLICQR